MGLVLIAFFVVIILAAIYFAHGKPTEQLYVADNDAWHVKPLLEKPPAIFTDERNQRTPKSVPPGWTDTEEQRGQRWSKRNIWYETEVVGESNYQTNIESFCAGGSNVELTADLILENDNPHDPKAVRIVIGGKTVGYLSRQDARTYRKMLTAGSADTTYHALVRGGLGNRGIYLSLDMRNFERTH